MHQKCHIIVAVSGFVCLVLGVIGAWYGFPKLVDFAVKQQTALKEGSPAFEVWNKMPFPMKFKVYLFHVVNPYEVQNGASPIVKEAGPYIYDLYRSKVNVKINETSDTAEYFEQKKYYFNAEDSGCRSEDDMVTIVNPILVGTALKTEKIMAASLSTVSDIIPYLFPGIKDIFLRAKVRDVLFDGILLSCAHPEMMMVCNSLKALLPETVRQHPNKRDFLFSFFHHLNHSLDGPLVVQLGNKENSTKGILVSWKGISNQTRWYGEQCNLIKGGDGATLPSNISPKVKRFYVFSTDLCRWMYVEKEKEVMYKDILTYRFHSPGSVVAINKENDCFCPKTKDAKGNTVSQCSPKGTFDIYPCVTAPTLVSFPHFLTGDEKLVKWVQGLSPNKEKHENHMYLDPLTGSPLAGHKRVQMNIQIKNFAKYGFEIMSNVSDGVMPILWIDEGVEIPDYLLAKIQEGHMGIKLLKVVKWVLILSGLVLIMISLTMVMKRENLLCFSNNGSAKVSQLHSSRKNRHDQPITISDSTMKMESGKSSNLAFNTSIAYPTIYEQHNNALNENAINLNPNLVRRTNNISFPEGANWTFKN